MQRNFGLVKTVVGVNLSASFVGIDVVVAKLGDVTTFVGIPSTWDVTINNILNPIYDNM